MNTEEKEQMERDVERALVKGIEALGGKAFKFVSPGNAGTYYNQQGTPACLYLRS